MTKSFRPAEVETLLADPKNSEKKLRWKPKIKFKDLVIEMVETDLKNVRDKFISLLLNKSIKTFKNFWPLKFFELF